MKKLIFISMCTAGLLFTSCDGDDVEDVACEVAEGTLETAVEAAIDAYDSEQTETTCQALKDVIEEYQDLECTSEVAYADVLLTLPVDCANAGN